MTNDLENLFKLEQERLSSLDKYKKQFEDIDNLIEALKKREKKANTERKKEINEAIQEEKKAREDLENKLNKQAKINILNQEKIALNSVEKVYIKKIIAENDYKKALDKFFKARTQQEKDLAEITLNATKKIIEEREKEEELAKKALDYEEKRSKLVKKAQTLREIGDKKAAKLAEAERKRLTLTAYKENIDRRLEEGTISKAEYKQAQKDIKNMELQAKNEEMFANLGDTIKKGLTDALNKGLNQINVAIEDVTSHRTGIMARLQGIGGGEYDYEGLLDTVGKNLAVSPYITQKAFMKKLDEAVDKGIAYNVEQRAFLNTIKDDISTTFDAFDSSLLRLIRLQQADSTAARLGMEAALTRTLNSVFTDTSYLSDMYDNISAAIVESEALMTRNAATEFEYVVQKWMGALYSLGASNALVSQVAQGLNYIGTGNVQALASNSPLQTLFAMSASKSGLDYADLLVKGLDASNANKLLKSMVEYLKEIAEDNRNNNVVKAAYGDLYNMSLADMRAITSLTEGDISSIYSQNMSYSDMQGSLASQFNAISKRLSTGEMIKNVIDNFIYSTGSEIAQNAITYTMWQITDLIENATGGIHLPAISVFGNMVDLSSFTIEGIMKTGIVGLATLGQIGNIVSSIGNKGGLNLGAWGYTDMLQRGQIEEQRAGSITGTSGSTYVGSNSSSDIKNSSIAGATEESKEVSEITNADSENEYSFDDWYKAILIDNNPIFVKSAEEFSAYDIYKAMYKDKTPVPVTVDQNTGLGAILMNLTAYMTSVNRVTDVNIKKADIPVPTTVYKLDNKLKEEIKNYIKTTYLDQLATELREALIGQTRGLGNATIAKVCDKILNDKVDVEVKNNNFDRFLDIQSGFVG